ncbi:MAG: branched-chain amino acid aminotransferase [Bdellovibrio sp.]
MTFTINKSISPSARLLPANDKLGFGQFFTDHIFTANYTEGDGWNSAEIKPYQNFQIDPGASVFHYGQALFEGLKAFRQMDGRIVLYRPQFNAARIQDGADRLCMAPPPLELTMQAIRELVKVDERWVPSGKGTSLYIRPTLIGTEAFLGVRPSKSYLYFIMLSPVGAYYGEGAKTIKIWVEDKYLRAAPGGLGAVKAGANYAGSLKAAFEAKKKGYAQVLWLDTSREAIEEVGTMNVFFVFKNEIVTPALNGSILPGGTRDCVLHLLKHWNLPIRERKLTVAEVEDAHAAGDLLEVFGTGTAAVISPVGELCFKGKPMTIGGGDVGPLSLRLLEEISGIQYGERKDQFGWIEPIY